MKTLKQHLENNLIFENPNTKPITKAVKEWLQEHQTEIEDYVNGQYKQGHRAMLQQLIEEIEQT